MATSGVYAVLVLTVVSIATADEGFGYEDNTFDEKEFEYFYNMELLEKLELLTNNETEIDETILLQLAEDDLEYEDTTELDMILDKLLEEGDLIDKVLDEMEDEISAITMHEDESSMDLFNQILFYGFLISFIVMFNFTFTGVLLRNSLLASSMLFNTEAGYNVRIAELSLPETVDFTKAPKSTPKEMLILELGVLPFKEII